MRGVGWSDGRLAGVDLERSSDLNLPFAEGGVRLRLQHQAGTTTAVVSPRLGLELLGETSGSGNPGFTFGDSIDNPENDRQYGITALDGDMYAAAFSFSGAIVARWGLRPTDRTAADVDGNLRSSEALADITFNLRGSPHKDVAAVADAVYDARLARWTVFDVRSRWQVAERVEVLYNGAYVPRTALADANWLHRAGGALQLNRYRLDLWGEVRPDGANQPSGRSVDLWHIGVARRMVDGLATIAYENSYDPTQDGIDQRVTATFTVGPSSAAGDPVRQSFGF